MTQSPDTSGPLTEVELAYFTGTETYYKHPLGMQYTDGVQYLAERASAYWLLDAIASWQRDPQVKNDPMLQGIQFWKLTISDDQSAVLACERDAEDIAVSQAIAFTDFPLQQITLYVQNNTILLPSEC